MQTTFPWYRVIIHGIVNDKATEIQGNLVQSNTKVQRQEDSKKGRQ